MDNLARYLTELLSGFGESVEIIPDRNSVRIAHKDAGFILAYDIWPTKDTREDGEPVVARVACYTAQSIPVPYGARENGGSPEALYAVANAFRTQAQMRELLDRCDAEIQRAARPDLLERALPVV